jgi:hypothetical protein
MGSCLVPDSRLSGNPAARDRPNSYAEGGLP